MSRVGCLLLIVFAGAIGAFLMIARLEPASRAPAPSPAVRPPVNAVPAKRGHASLVIPVSGVEPAQLSDTWGDARGDGTRAHHAIDILAPRGTPVVAAAAGRVEKIFESGNGGHTVYVRVDPGTIHYYAHLDAYAPGLAEGQAVGQGTVIGTVGSSGDASAQAPHLHFEVKRMGRDEKWWQGTEIDPFPLLAGR